MKYTLIVDPEDSGYAIALASRYLNEFPDNQKHKRLDAHGVIFRRENGNVFYVYGDDRHVRVKFLHATNTTAEDT